MARRSIKSKALPDRRGGLTFFGILQVLLALFFGGFIALPIFTSKNFPPNTKFSPWVIGSYVLALAAFWIVLGFGSIFAKRWARALILIQSWVWLLIGVVTVGILFVQMSTLNTAAPKVPASGVPVDMTWVYLSIVLVLALLLVMIPGLLIFFYTRPSVKATLEAVDKDKSWTDQVPLPLLAFCLMMTFGWIVGFPMFGSMNFVMVLFGIVFSGAAGALVLFLLFVLNLYLAWGLYHLRVRAWWMTLGYYAIFAISYLFMNPDKWLQYYQAMNLPSAEMERIQKDMSFHDFTFMGLAGMAVMVAYLLFLKRYFPKETPKKPSPSRRVRVVRKKAPARRSR